MPTGIYDHSSRIGFKHSKGTINKIKLARKKQVKENHPNWKGGKIFRGKYIYIKVYNHPMGGKQGYIAEHRIVMEKYLNRFLNKGEVVHHINGIETDNRIDNLQLFSSPGKHTKESHKDLFEKQKLLFKGKHFSRKTEFKKERIPWNKGLKS
jgi:hypothetical protein